MKVAVWGSRGSLAAPGRDTARYGGNTSCVQVVGGDGTVLVLDAGTGIRALRMALPAGLNRVDVLLTHLHLDHIQGLGFFAPLFNPRMEVHIWGPASATLDLRARLSRYLSAPLFPVPLCDLPCRLILHEAPAQAVRVGEFEITSALVCHPGPTVGYRITGPAGVMAYLPDHEPAMGEEKLSRPGDWTSGHLLARDADLLLHDAQYTVEEYAGRVGWGHSSIDHAFQFAAQARVKCLVPFHHDPGHDDATLDRLTATAVRRSQPAFRVSAAREGATFLVEAPGKRAPLSAAN